MSKSFGSLKRCTEPRCWVFLPSLRCSAKSAITHIVGLSTICCNCSSVTRILSQSRARYWQNHSMYPPRAHLFGLIAELISSAAPSSNVRCRRLRRARSLKLWTTILRLISDAAGLSLEKTSQLGPVPMQRRFQSALQIQRQRRWTYAPFQRRTVGPDFSAMTSLPSSISVQ
jgi:hypothetical protein